MKNNHIFISHATADDDFVKELRVALEGLGLKLWVDSRNLIAGQQLDPEIEEAIKEARQVIVVLSKETVNSAWVRKEVQKAREVEGERKEESYRVIPLLLEGLETSALGNWFDTEPLAVPIQLKPGGLSEAMPQIFVALGEQLPDDWQQQPVVESTPIEELVLELIDPNISTRGGKRRGKATATLVYEPADKSVRQLTSERFTFTAPFGPIETDDIRWYLERYHVWPVGVFKERAERIETQLPEWGQLLYEAALKAESAQDGLNAWKEAASGAERRFSVEVDPKPPEGAAATKKTATEEAATLLLSLPWELLHDGKAYLFQGKLPVRVRRRFPFRRQQQSATATLPIRILLVSPRPENEHTGYIDHRVSARPLVEAIERLGDLVTLTVLNPPTIGALQTALERADEAKQPFDVVHFDGHGVYDKQHGLGGLCFENPQDTQKLYQRDMEFISAERMATICRDYRIPLVFLEACQSATEENPTASVAAKLLEEGVTSVVAMSHSVLVETARRFVEAFYQELARGARVGRAMLAGQRALNADSFRRKIMGGVDLHLQDWFVPVLYQETQDRQLLTVLQPEAVQQLQATERRLSLGKLPEPPKHTFIGRSRELLALERLLHNHQYAVVIGTGGSGKTALAVEEARWLVRTHRFRRAAFVSLETYLDVRTVLMELGRQLLPDGEEWYVDSKAEPKQARQLVERALRDMPTLIVLDNLESVLPDSTGQLPPGVGSIQPLLELCTNLLNASDKTRLIFTSRESLPKPFNRRGQKLRIGALREADAVELVSAVMANEGLTPNAGDSGVSEAEVKSLVAAVNRHARALVLIARDVDSRGVRTTTEALSKLMAELDKKHPGDRENSLYASLELSLRRLPPEAQANIHALAPFHGGANLAVLMLMLEMDTEEVNNFAIPLIQVGLADAVHPMHLRLDPALAPYLRGKLDDAELTQMRTRWAEAMTALTGFLYQQAFKDANLAFQLTLLELPNLLAWLTWMQETGTPERVIVLVDRIETLLAELGRPQALAEVARIRKEAAAALGESEGWTHARYLAESKEVDRLLEHGELQSALTLAQEVLERCLSAGETAYPEAAYDTAMAYIRLGRVLKNCGSAEAALEPLSEAKRRFQGLADAGSASAEGMASAAITERADCLMFLGRLDEAVAAYEEAIRRGEKRDDKRGVAVSKGQLGTVRLLQNRYADALKIYAEARTIFEGLGEPRHVATAWHQIGMVHQKAGGLDKAEGAYRQSLAIKVQQGNRPGEASSLNQLGGLYDKMDRLEEAVTFLRQALDIDVELGDTAKEGLRRSNLALMLIKLERYDDARRELRRAIECGEPLGHAAEPWKTWHILHDLEIAVGNRDAAAAARQKAIETYLDYRKAGGESHEPAARLCAMVAQAIQQGNTAQVEQFLAQASESAETLSEFKVMIPKLQAILRGNQASALADAPELHYRVAVELRLLLESL